MRNRAINTLRYAGIVTLSQHIGSKKIKIAQMHNTGASPLFDFLADCLVGDFDMAKVTRPTKIMLLEHDSSKNVNDNTSYSPLQGGGGFIYLLTKPEKVYEDIKSVVRYSFIIPRDILDSINDFEKLYIGLYTDGTSVTEPENYAAICKVDLAKGTLASASLVVDWELIISNISNNTSNRS
jgi:hypothetical protein